MTKIKGFQILKTTPNADGLFPVQAIPFTGNNILLQLSEEALIDIAQLHADLRQTHDHPKKSADLKPA